MSKCLKGFVKFQGKSERSLMDYPVCRESDSEERIVRSSFGSDEDVNLCLLPNRFRELSDIMPISQ